MKNLFYLIMPILTSQDLTGLNKISTKNNWKIFFHEVVLSIDDGKEIYLSNSLLSITMINTLTEAYPKHNVKLAPKEWNGRYPWIFEEHPILKFEVFTPQKWKTKIELFRELQTMNTMISKKSDQIFL